MSRDVPPSEQPTVPVVSAPPVNAAHPRSPAIAPRSLLETAQSERPHSASSPPYPASPARYDPKPGAALPRLRLQQRSNGSHSDVNANELRQSHPPQRPGASLSPRLPAQVKRARLLASPQSTHANRSYHAPPKILHRAP